MAFNASRIRAAGEIGTSIGGIIGGVGTSMMAFGGLVGVAGGAVKLLGEEFKPIINYPKNPSYN
jgi:hypothetical protein